MRQDDSLPRRPDLHFEIAARARGARLIAGVDEAGRGPLAGPVVVAAVMLDENAVPEGLNDSKKLTARRRDALFVEIFINAHVGVAVAPPSIIDRLNIRGATLWAMRQAVRGLGMTPDLALIDGRDVPPGLPCPGEAIIGGDGKSLSIAAASIIAKVVRDRMCPVMDRDQPGYSFSCHKGYGTAAHLQALASVGPSVHHRLSFAPVRALLACP